MDRVLRELGHLQVPLALLVSEIRAVLDERRTGLLAGEAVCEKSIAACVEQRLHLLLRPSLCRVINATGIVLHTNLGRAPLPDVTVTTGYSNLEFDLDSGKRGKRDVHVGALLQKLLERPAIVVNNNAAAVFLVLNELASGHEVIVSRGELIEIGDGFRIPEIMARSGAILREVGTTNRTRVEDYAEAISDKTRLIMRVHPSNFHMSGFTERPSLASLSKLGAEREIPVYEDLGSGCLVDLRQHGICEPLVSASLSAGINLVSFSGDKLLGGPQCGMIAGDMDLVARLRRNPLYRALRVDKLILQALEDTLKLVLLENWSSVPALRMIMTAVGTLRARAERVARELGGMTAIVRESTSPIGGGSTPDIELPTWVVELTVASASRFEQELRSAAVPVVARIEREKVLLDMRTISDSEEELLVASVLEAISSQAS